MARKRAIILPDEDDEQLAEPDLDGDREPAPIEFRDPPPKGGVGTNWTGLLYPLTKAPNRWAMIKECESPEQAQKAQSNLHRRKVTIPYPDHDWAFSSRGCELFAIYHGKKRPYVGTTGTKRVRRTQRKANQS